MAKVVKKVTQKKVTATKKTVKPTAKKATVKLSAPVDDSLLKAAIEGAGYKVV